MHARSMRFLSHRAESFELEDQVSPPQLPLSVHQITTRCLYMQWRIRFAYRPQATKLCPGNLLLVFPVCWWRLINRTRNNYKSKRSIMDSLFVEWTGRTRRWYTLACVGVKQAEAGLNGCWNVVAWNVYTVNTCINKYGSTRVAKCGPRNAYSYQHTLFAWLHHNRRILPESSHKPLLLRGPNARWSGRPIPTRSTTNETNSTLLLCTAHNVSNGISRASISQFSFILFFGSHIFPFKKCQICRYIATLFGFCSSCV